MGTHIEAFICFDDNPPNEDYAPFDLDPSYWDLTGDWRFSVGHHYEFYAAIAGARNESGKEPLIPLRGLPKVNPTDPMRDRLYKMNDLCENIGVSWLSLSEIEASLRHMGVDRNSLHESVQLVLEAMSVAANRFGDNRVRLIFGFH